MSYPPDIAEHASLPRPLRDDAHSLGAQLEDRLVERCARLDEEDAGPKRASDIERVLDLRDRRAEAVCRRSRR